MSQFTTFDFVNESPHRWEESLAQKSSDGVTTIKTRVFWGAHERLPGVRDFFRSARLRLEKFLKAAQASQLKVELTVGFFPSAETLPEWTWSTCDKVSVPASIWYPVKGGTLLAEIPSLGDPRLQQGFAGFCEELISLLHLYQHPGGPVTKLELDLGVYRHAFPSTECEAFQNAFVSLYPDVAALNERYGASFKNVRTALTKPGFRTLTDKRPWVASVDYRKARDKAWLDVAAAWNLPRVTGDSVEHGTIALVEGAMLEHFESSFVPIVPNGILNAQATLARRGADLIADKAQEKSIPCFSTEDAELLKFRKAFVFTGKFLKRSTYEHLVGRDLGEGALVFPMGLPQFDESLKLLDWSAAKQQKRVATLSPPATLDKVGDVLNA